MTLEGAGMTLEGVGMTLEGAGVMREVVGMTERLLVQVELDLPTSPGVVKPVLSSTDIQDVVLG